MDIHFQYLPRTQAKVLEFGEIDSTNEEAKRRIAHGKMQQGLWLIANTQSHGRGRLGRDWVSPSGNLYTSLGIIAPTPPARAAQTSYIAALSVADALREVLPPICEIKVKWPNDVLVNGLKIAGILLETLPMPYAGHEMWLVIGIGVNLTDKPEETRWPATYLREQGGADMTALAFLDILAYHWAGNFKRWNDLGFAVIQQAWMRIAYGLGLRVAFRDERAGIFLGLNEEGGARIRLDNGIETLIHAGELYFR